MAKKPEYIAVVRDAKVIFTTKNFAMEPIYLEGEWWYKMDDNMVVFTQIVNSIKRRRMMIPLYNIAMIDGETLNEVELQESDE